MSEIYTALAKAQQAMNHAALDAENPHFKSKYASLKSVIDAVKNPLNDNGITFYQRSDPSQGGVAVETVLAHVSGETISTGLLRVPCDKDNAHGFGSSLTYAKRYSLAMACGISADNDDDANAGTNDDLFEYNACLRECFHSVATIKTGILTASEDSEKEAAEAWFELTETEKRILWKAPTKGGIFTTQEREWIKNEARRLHYGDVKA